MNVLIVGSGGREHALAWKISQSARVETVYCAPGNPGIARLPKGVCVAMGVNDFDAIETFVREQSIGLTVVGPEDPLVNGLVDRLEAQGFQVFGPRAAAARLEGSKAFAKAFMVRHGIPTAHYAEFTEAGAALDYVREQGAPIVVKADGLAAGKGVTVAQTVPEAEAAIREAMLEGAFGTAGSKVVIEECLVGEEASILALCDGKTVVALPSSQDHKAAYDGDTGPNTGGMGAYSPAPVITPELSQLIQEQILSPVIRGMAEEGTPYKGILYAGLMITAAGPKVIEFNVRFGDPETQVVLPRLQTDLTLALEACCAGSLGQLPIDCSDSACVTVVMASGGYPKDYPKGLRIDGIDAAEALPDVMVFHAGTKLEGECLRTSGGRVLNVTARGNDIREAIKRAYAAMDHIRFEGAHFRKDIGHRALQRMR